jgi:hypothetical protein
MLGSCSLNLAPDTFKDLDLFPDPEPIHTGYDFSSRERAEAYLAARLPSDPVEGIWSFGGGEPPQHPLYEVAIISDDEFEVSEFGFLGIVIKSSNESFGSGDLKFAFDAANSEGDYQGTYYTGSVRDWPAIFVLLEPDLIAVPVFAGGEWQDVNIRRINTAVVADKDGLQ